MVLVHFASQYADPAWLRQTPGGDGAWGDARFVMGEAEDPDWLVVLHRPGAPLATRVPRARRIAVLTEPPEVFPYTSAYLAQFGTVISMAPLRVAGVEVLERQVGMPWFYGREGAAPLDWEGLKAAPGAPKTRPMSVICSSKARTPTQIRRMRFVERLQTRLGDRVDLFGRGVRPFADKREALDPYERHIVLENNLHPHGWTEKLADALLAECFPVFAGGADLSRYFPHAAFAAIDLRRPDAAVDAVERLLDAPQGEEERRAVREAKARLMHRWNLWAQLAGTIAERADRAALPRLPAPETLRPAPKRSLARLRRSLLPRPVRLALWRGWFALTDR